MREIEKLLETLKKEGYEISKRECQLFTNYDILNKWNNKKITINLNDMRFYKREEQLLDIIHETIGEISIKQNLLCSIDKLLDKAEEIGGEDYAAGFDEGWQSGYLEATWDCIKLIKKIVE